MTRRQKTLIWLAAAVIITVAVVKSIQSYRSTRPVVITGAVVRNDTDPIKRSPLAAVKVTVPAGPSDEAAVSDASGLFKLTLHPFVLTRNRPVTLRFEHPQYRPQEITAAVKDLLYVVRLEPLTQAPSAPPDQVATSAKPVQITHVRLRYSIKTQTTVNVGSLARQFEVVNAGDVPCQGRRPCSPDGRWKAASTTIAVDAEKGNEFRNIRASCIAGPCPFTKLDPIDLSRPSRKIDITVLNWSDTASFLVEAEVTRTMTTEMLRYSYPFVTGQTITFALPAAAEGPSIVAEVNADEIVFPLGPNLILSWATCAVEVAPGGNKLYRCELKPGFHSP